MLLTRLRADLSGLLLILCGTIVYAEAGGGSAERHAAVGRWSTGGTLIEVSATGESLSAKLIALKHPLYRPKEQRGEVGKPKLDDLNPDPALRHRPLIGLELFSDFEFRRGRWSGRLYSPENGRSFSARLWVNDGELHVRGYILGMPWLGRSRSLQPASVCDEDILRMIEIAEISEPACMRQ